MCLPPAVPTRLVAAAVLAAAGLLASPDRAAAGCGDYVVLAETAPGTDHTPASPVPQPPCHGPGCSGRPTEAPSPSAPVTHTADPDQLALPTGRVTARTAPASWAAVADDASPPDPLRRPVFHPPRIG
ncbi:MAG: hypothetical protein K2X82_30650 [Gemmataceae bacterium]|nr:hypothetical protein [Gemmataceae bacterium]